MKGTTCKKCKRFVWSEDVGEEGLCCFCKPKVVFPEPDGNSEKPISFGETVYKKSKKKKSWQ
jgi:hypothetical protein